MKGGTPPAWMREQERSHLGALRLMVWISLRLGRPFGRAVLRFVDIEEGKQPEGGEKKVSHAGNGKIGVG